jgi:energy-coupling factor transporter ATP-binding protein EcfA2
MISFSNINKQYGKQLLFVDASFQLNPGEKVGLVGPNGSGKTTLFRMVVGEETPDEGRVTHLCIAPFPRRVPHPCAFSRVGGDAAGATLVRSTPPVVYAVVVPALFAYAKDGAPASVVASVV